MTARGTWKQSESRAAKWHNPKDGKRTPLSGGNSGGTRADAKNQNGLFIEAKYRKTWSLWTLTRSTAILAQREGKIPVVTLFEKNKRGFVDCIHSEYIERYIHILEANREIKIEDQGNVNWCSGRGIDTDLLHLYTGNLDEIRTLIRNICPSRSFDKKTGRLTAKWWVHKAKTPEDTIYPYVIIPDGLMFALWGTWSGMHLLEQAPYVETNDLTKYYRR